jgi:hypothetical protein
MRREDLLAALRRARIVAALRALPGRPAAARALEALAALRRRPDAVVAVLLGMGVLAMILHWR